MFKAALLKTLYNSKITYINKMWNFDYILNTYILYRVYIDYEKIKYFFKNDNKCYWKNLIPSIDNIYQIQ